MAISTILHYPFTSGDSWSKLTGFFFFFFGHVLILLLEACNVVLALVINVIHKVFFFLSRGRTDPAGKEIG